LLSSGVIVGAGVLNSSGLATVTVNNLPAGTDGLQAVYNGDTNNGLSFSPIQTVTVGTPLPGTVTSLAGPSSTSLPGNSLGFTTSVLANSGTTVPTGTVTFDVDLMPGVAVTLNTSGQATFDASRLTPGTHTITASYSGDTNYSPSRGTPLVFHVTGVWPPKRLLDR
jgi:hypothetical protein